MQEKKDKTILEMVYSYYQSVLYILLEELTAQI